MSEYEYCNCNCDQALGLRRALEKAYFKLSYGTTHGATAFIKKVLEKDKANEPAKDIER